MRKPQIIFILAVLVVGGVISLFMIRDSGIPMAPEECFDRANEYEEWLCLEPYFKMLVNKVSVSYAMDEVQHLQDEGVVNNCHFLVHVIGEANLEKHNFDPGKAFATCEFGCAEGCFHGVMERYVRYEADPYMVTAQVKSMCDTVGISMFEVGEEEVIRDMGGECAHGVGHGLISHGFLSIPDATRACQGFDNEYYERRCRGGIMMEHVMERLGGREDKLLTILPEICEPFRELIDEQRNWYQKCWDKALRWSANIWNENKEE